LSGNCDSIAIWALTGAPARERTLPMTETLRTTIDVAAVRDRFSSLRGDFAFLDAPGGSQVPDEVGDAIARTLREASANMGAGYPTSQRVGRILAEAEQNAARFLGCDPHEVMFGQNMTSLNFTLSRTAGRSFQPGDEILVSSLDHDGGVAPWLELAHDKDLVVRHIELNPDTTLNLDDLRSKLGPRTRVVAFAWASNAIGTVVDARRVCDLAHEAGALAWIDAVHYAAHEPIDVREIGADVLLCSPYKFCGPHLGLACGRAEVMETWRPYKARPAPTSPLGRRFATGTHPYELLAGSAPPRTTWRPSAVSRRSCRTSGRWGSASWTASQTRSRCTGCRGWTAGCRRSSSTSRACPPSRSPASWPTRRSGCGRTTRGTR